MLRILLVSAFVLIAHGSATGGEDAGSSTATVSEACTTDAVALEAACPKLMELDKASKEPTMAEMVTICAGTCPAALTKAGTSCAGDIQKGSDGMKCGCAAIKIEAGCPKLMEVDKAGTEPTMDEIKAICSGTCPAAIKTAATACGSQVPDLQKGSTEMECGCGEINKGVTDEAAIEVTCGAKMSDGIKKAGTGTKTGAGAASGKSGGGGTNTTATTAKKAGTTSKASLPRIATLPLFFVGAAMLQG